MAGADREGESARSGVQAIAITPALCLQRHRRPHRLAHQIPIRHPRWPATGVNRRAPAPNDMHGLNGGQGHGKNIPAMTRHRVFARQTGHATAHGPCSCVVKLIGMVKVLKD